MYIVHGAKGAGSVMVEAALTLLDLEYEVVEAALVGDRPGDEQLAAVNPMRQVPALILPSGEVMTESAAILIWLADAHPEARLAPTMAELTRPAFLRWMAYVASAIYALYWVRDEPLRVAPDAETGAVVKARLGARITDCWRMMDTQIDPGRYLLGDDLGVLDLYVTVVSRWAQGRKRFYEAAPKMSAVVRRVDAEPRLAPLWAERFPFTDRWEG
jgi:GST-like protein